MQKGTYSYTLYGTIVVLEPYLKGSTTAREAVLALSLPRGVYPNILDVTSDLADLILEQVEDVREGEEIVRREGVEGMSYEELDHTVDLCLDRALQAQLLNSFLPSQRERVSQEECLGLIVARRCDWKPDRILRTCYEALLDAGSIDEAISIAKLLGDEQLEQRARDKGAQIF